MHILPPPSSHTLAHATITPEAYARILANAMDPLESLLGTFFSDSELNSFQPEQR